MKPGALLVRLPAMGLAVFWAASTGGCGFILVHGPPEGHERMEYFSCTESDAGPILDLAAAGLNVLGAVLCAADPEAYEDSYYDSGACIALSLGWAVASGASAAVGFNKTKKCRAAKQQLAERQAQQRLQGREQPPQEVVQAVVVRPRTDTLAVGDQLQLLAAAYNSSGAIIPDRMFVWSSSNDAIASVSNAGLVTAHATGEVVVAARTDNVVGTATLVVVSRR